VPQRVGGPLCSNRESRRLERRVIAFHATRELIPLFGVYALLFSDRGVSPGATSSLFIIWSTASVLFEIPSGAWADIVDRRVLLILSGPVYAAGFATWIVWPSYPGFAIGFVLWGLSSAMMSGTFEALVYDELAARGEEATYARLLGRVEAATMVTTMVGMAAGGPLFAAGGYALVGWISVVAALGHGLLALTLPRAPRAETAEETLADPDPDYPDPDHPDHPDRARSQSLAQRYVAMLHDGVTEATHHRRVRHIVLISAVLMGITAYDEYFGLVARDTGADTADIPILMALVAVGQVVGTTLAGRTAALSRRPMAVVVAAAGVLVAIGAVIPHPVGIVGIAAGYGLAHNAMVVADARLQDAITGRARATVTSVTGFSSEAFAVGCYTFVALGSSWLATGTLVALLCLPVLLVALAVRVWWPDAEAASGGDVTP